MTYAVPVGGSGVRGAVATTTRQALKSDGITPGNYLGYSEIQYDTDASGAPLPLGQVGVGNPTHESTYTGPTDIPAQPITDSIIEKRYAQPGCPGLVTLVVDPMGAPTRTTYDATCTFPLKVQNALSHTATIQHYGVDGRPLADPTTKLQGLYGQVEAETSANGARTLTGYDNWGRVTATVGPYQSPERPGAVTAYTDARCVDARARRVPCEAPDAAYVAAPALTTVSAWDDVRHAYRVTHAFGDGQAQSQVIRAGGVDDWLYSGAQDYDALGRVITTYKPRYRPAACPPAGEWCPPGLLNITDQVNPLRDPAVVAHVQTAYDSHGRVVRTYGPDVPACADPSAVDGTGKLLCDAGATPSGHYTAFEYPAPGVARTIDARGVPSVVYLDAYDRTRRVEEYLRTSSAPYATSEYTYDLNGNMIAAKDIAGNTTTAVYDALGRKKSTSDPDMGNWAYEYDKRGQLTSQIDAVGALTWNEYDPLGRLTRTKYYSPSMELDTYRNYTFDGENSDSEQTDPIFAYGSLLWRKGPQFESQAHIYPTQFNWDNVPLSPLALIAGNTDDGAAQLALPFDFALTPNHTWALSTDGRATVTPIPGSNLFLAGHTLYVSTNGKIRFDAGGASDSRPPATRPRLPVTNYEIALYPLWNDLVMSGGMSHAVAGTAPHRRLIVQWDGVFFGDPHQRKVLFRAILYEGTHEVRYQYNQLPFFGSGGGSGNPPEATIGLQNHSRTTPDAVGTELQNPWAVHGAVFSGDALTSLGSSPNNVLQYNNGTTYAINKQAWGKASFGVDLTDATKAELSFKHSWNTRCGSYPRGSCPFDQMLVEYRVHGASGMATLLSHADLTADDALNAGSASMSLAPTVSALFPQHVMGKKVTVYFSFNTVDAGGGDARYGWLVDDIRVRKTVQPLEDVVERRYDSAEPSFDYEASKPVLDLTFDVPGDVVDRTPFGTEQRAKGIWWRIKATPGIGSGDGVSGRALLLDGSTTRVDVDATRLTATPGSPFNNGLTAEAWVNPDLIGNSGDRWLLGKSGTFALRRNAAGDLMCTVEAGGSSVTKTGGSLPASTWSHVALIYDGMQVFCTVNGLEPSGQPGALSGPPNWLGNPMTVGAELQLLLGTDPHAFAGLMDEVRVFASARSPAEILADAQTPHRHGPPRGNVLDLRFIDPWNWGIDASGANNHADLKQGGADPVPGVQGTSARFGGASDRFITVPDSPSLVLDQLTAEVWMKADGPLMDRLLVGKWNGGDLGWRLAIDDLPGHPGHVRFEVRTRVFGPNTWTDWPGDTTGLSVQGNGSCGLSATSTASKLWIAPSTGPFSFTTVGSAAWDTVLLVRDEAGNELACNNDAGGTVQSTVQINAVQGKHYTIFVGGAHGPGPFGAQRDAGPFTVTVLGLGPDKTNTSFTTRETVDNGQWWHVAGTYDGHILRVYLNGKPAHRLCRQPPTNLENPVEGAEIACEPPPVTQRPPPDCRVEWSKLDLVEAPTGVCVTGSVSDHLPIYIGNYDPAFFSGHPSRRAGSDVFWYHPEHLGGTNLMTDLMGNERQDAYAEYLPFGSPLATAGNNTGGANFGQNTPDRTTNTSGGFQFSHKEVDSTGLYYYGARYYEPYLGRFIEADPLLPTEAPQGLNRYSYVFNNPLKYVDPTGHQPENFTESELEESNNYLPGRDIKFEKDTVVVGRRLEFTSQNILTFPQIQIVVGGNIERSLEFQLTRFDGRAYNWTKMAGTAWASFAGGMGGAAGAAMVYRSLLIGRSASTVGAMRRLDYESSAKHGTEVRSTVKGVSNPAPAHGQDVLDFSIQVKSTSPRRVGIDDETGDFVVFDQTTPGVYHGHTRTWAQLENAMRSALQRAGMADRVGRILGGR